MADRAGEMRGTSPGLVGEVRARQTGFVRRRLFRRSSRLASSSFNSFRGPRGANEDATRRATPRAGITRREGRSRSSRVVRVIGRGRRRARATQGARRHPRRTPQSEKRSPRRRKRFTRFDSRRRLASRWTTTTPRAFESRAWPRYGGTGACFSARCGPFATTRRARLAFANRSSRWRLPVLNRSDRSASARGETSRGSRRGRATSTIARMRRRRGARYAPVVDISPRGAARWRRVSRRQRSRSELRVSRNTGERASTFGPRSTRGGLLRPNHGGAVDVRANVDVRRASALTNRATVHVATLRVVVRRRRRVRVAGTKKGPVLDGANPPRRRDMRADVAVARHRVQGDPRTRPRRPTRSRRTMRTGLEAPRQRQGGAADPVEKVLRERR